MNDPESVLSVFLEVRVGTADSRCQRVVDGEFPSVSCLSKKPKRMNHFEGLYLE
jgi:hypothetical protein